MRRVRRKQPPFDNLALQEAVALQAADILTPVLAAQHAEDGKHRDPEA